MAAKTMGSWTVRCLMYFFLIAAIDLPAAALEKVPNFSTVDARIKWIEKNLASPLERKHGAKPHTIKEELKRFQVPGISVAVIYEGKIDWAKGYGVIEAGKKNPVTPETLFQAASISKPFSALGALCLVRDGKLSLDDEVNHALTEWKIPKSELGAVTLRQLLSHRGGLTVHGFPGYEVGAPLPTVVQILNGEPPANNPAIVIEKTPGAQFQYSGGGYTVLQLLMMEVSGMPFPEFMRARVLDPLGMHHSTYAQPLPGDFQKLTATAHEKNVPVSGKRHVYPELAAAALWTTAADLATAAIALQNAKLGKSDVVLDKAGVEAMWTMQGDGPCGLGFFISGKDGALRFEHGGSNLGFTCTLVAYQDLGLGAAIMTNSSNGPRLYNELLDAIARAYNWPGYIEADQS